MKSVEVYKPALLIAGPSGITSAWLSEVLGREKLDVANTQCIGTGQMSQTVTIGAVVREQDAIARPEPAPGDLDVAPCDAGELPHRASGSCHAPSDGLHVSPGRSPIPTDSMPEGTTSASSTWSHNGSKGQER